MGVAVFAGMLGVTLFGLALTPVFYLTVRRFGSERPRKRKGHVALETPLGEDP